ncbi:hypothetical protein [Leptothermofonsia sp. ETS-13]|uniref:hypothetical protein n=1 Tax=Leptothermofonsia sp. ETS-13 TaxID=3035696 RepID=UPI003BA03124
MNWNAAPIAPSNPLHCHVSWSTHRSPLNSASPTISWMSSDSLIASQLMPSPNTLLGASGHPRQN